MQIKKLFLISLSILLSGCTITLPNARVCAVSGVLSAGADCAYMNEDKTESMNLDETIAFLEPQIDPPRGAAICMSADDFTLLKIALEQACDKLGASCKKQAKESIANVSGRVERLQSRVLSRKKILKGKS